MHCFCRSHGEPVVGALGVLAINACASTHDIATDGLAVEMLKPEERTANGIQVGAYRLGMIRRRPASFLATLGWRNALRHVPAWA